DGYRGDRQQERRRGGGRHWQRQGPQARFDRSSLNPDRRIGQLAGRRGGKPDVDEPDLRQRSEPARDLPDRYEYERGDGAGGERHRRVRRRDGNGGALQFAAADRLDQQQRDLHRRREQLPRQVAGGGNRSGDDAGRQWIAGQYRYGVHFG